ARLRAGLAGQESRQREPGQPEPQAADPQELPTTEPLAIPRVSPVEQGQHWRNLVWVRGGRWKESPPFSSAAVGDICDVRQLRFSGRRATDTGRQKGGSRSATIGPPGC